MDPGAQILTEEEQQLLARRKGLVNLVIGSWGLSTLALLVASHFEVQLPEWTFPVLAAYYVAGAGGMFFLARCPRCRAYQPSLSTSRFCSKCGVGFVSPARNPGT